MTVKELADWLNEQDEELEVRVVGWEDDPNDDYEVVGGYTISNTFCPEIKSVKDRVIILIN